MPIHLHYLWEKVTPKIFKSASEFEMNALLIVARSWNRNSTAMVSNIGDQKNVKRGWLLLVKTPASVNQLACKT